MIKRLRIQNFQSHKNTEMEFSPGVNVIIGESDSGKSAIFRAVYWVLTNRPLGDSFSSHWGGVTKVEIEDEKGNLIIRGKGNGENKYIINGEQIKAFGTEPPQEVERTLGFDEFNIQRQSQPPFLLSLSPGETARVLNLAASLDEIDSTISSLNKALNSLTLEHRNLTQKKTELELELKKYKGLEKLGKEIEKLEEKTHELEKKKRDTQTLIQLIERAKTIHKELESGKGLEQGIKTSMILIKKLEEKEKEEKRVQGLKNLVFQWKSLNQNITSISSQVEELERKYHELIPDTCPICGRKIKK